MGDEVAGPSWLALSAVSLSPLSTPLVAPPLVIAALLLLLVLLDRFVSWLLLLSLLPPWLATWLLRPLLLTLPLRSLSTILLLLPSLLSVVFFWSVLAGEESVDFISCPFSPPPFMFPPPVPKLSSLLLLLVMVAAEVLLMVSASGDLLPATAFPFMPEIRLLCFPFFYETFNQLSLTSPILTQSGGLCCDRHISFTRSS